MIVPLLGGIGLFLLGMVLMTDGLKALAGTSLRRILTRFVRGPVSGMAWGTVLTALVQSSSATTVATIGFVSAGLLTFPQSVGVIFGANLGTTSTGWIVSLLGFKVSIGTLAMPLVFAGAVLRLVGGARLGGLGTAAAGFGLLFLGLDMLQTGMAGVTERFNLAAHASGGLGERLLLVGLGIAMSVIMQSSSAAVATTLAALHAGAVTLDQSAALVIGQGIGTTATAAFAAIGASQAAKRTALAHVLFNFIAGGLALALLPWMLTGVAGVIRALGSGEDAIVLAGFQTAFKALGVIVLLPFATPFARLITRIIPQRGPTLTQYLDASIAELGPVAVETARRTCLAIALAAVTVGREMLEARSLTRAAADHLGEIDRAVQETVAFVARLGAGNQQPDEVRRHLSLVHALDHLGRFAECCAADAPTPGGLLHPLVAPGVRLMRELLTAARESLSSSPPPTAAGDLGRASAALAALRKEVRAQVLEGTAAGRLEPDAASDAIESMLWMDRAGYHLWRASDHLREPSSPTTPASPAPGPGAGMMGSGVPLPPARIPPGST